MADEQKTAAAFLVGELRRARAGRGMSQEDLGKAINYSASLVSAVELGQQRPTADFLTRVDKALDTGGIFTRMLEEVVSVETTQPWLRPWVDVEREAATLRWHEPLHVPGLFQTEEYARAVFASGDLLDAEEVEKRLSARLDRQALLHTDSPPQFLATIDEGVLRRPVGGPKVMREQLLHLVRLGAEHWRLRIHVVPLSAGEYPGLGGPFILATLPDGQEVMHLEGVVPGGVSERAADLAVARRIWEATLSEALTPQQSIELMREVAETWS